MTTNNFNFKIFLNQQTGNVISGTNLGFTDKDEDYDSNRKTCFGSFFMFHKKDKNLYKVSIKLEDIKFLILKKYFYKNSAVEIFTKSNKSYFFNFKYEKDRKTFIDKLIKKIPKMKKIIDDFKDYKDDLNIIGYSFGNYFSYKESKLKDNENNNDILLSKIIKDWSKWRINNFSFLMHLNLFGNRSYMDLSQYPIFPWILTKYSSPIKLEHNCYEASLYYEYNKNRNSINDIESISNNSLEIEDKYIKKKKIYENYNYRDMKLPMGMMELSQKGKKRKEEFIEKYNDMVENQEDHIEKPFYYGSNYSNAFFVCNFLMRLFPFTHISIELQGKLDDPNRLFLSVQNSFENSTELQGDVRELIPEFFYFPEMMINLNKLNFEKKVNGQTIENVKMPSNFNELNQGENYEIVKYIEFMKNSLEKETKLFDIFSWIKLIFGTEQMYNDNKKKDLLFRPESYITLDDKKLNEYIQNNIIMNSTGLGLIPLQTVYDEFKLDKKKISQKKLDNKEIEKIMITNKKCYIIELDNIKNDFIISKIILIIL